MMRNTALVTVRAVFLCQDPIELAVLMNSRPRTRFPSTSGFIRFSGIFRRSGSVPIDPLCGVLVLVLMLVRRIHCAA